MRIWPAILLSLFFSQAVTATEFHVSPQGSADGDGSAAKPWDLATALSHPDSVKPGDTIWLHGGTYRGSPESQLEGTADAPIRVRQVPGERATISLEKEEGRGVGLHLRGEHTRFQGFEVVCENPVRETKTPGSWPVDLQRGSVNVRGSHLELINLVIHDIGVGVGFWREGEGGEIYGCLIYNNGWMAPDRSHGHAIYTQNERGTKKITDTFMFRQFGSGLHLYGTSKSSLRGFRIEGAIAFDNGRPGQTRNLLVGGGAPLEDVAVENCFTWRGGMQVGYGENARNNDVTIRNNYFVGGLRLNYPGPNYTIEGNTVVTTASLLTIQLRKGQKFDGMTMNRNDYFKTEKKWNPFAIYAPEGNRAGELEVLQQEGFDADSNFSKSTPSENRIFVRPNRHEPGRAHLIVYNWENKPTVEVDLGSVLEDGQAFRIVHARDYFGEPVAEGVFDETPVSIPMTPRKAVTPIGMESNPEMTELQFGAFVVLPVPS